LVWAVDVKSEQDPLRSAVTQITMPICNTAERFIRLLL
jgi:hypothetical protein